MIKPTLPIEATRRLCSPAHCLMCSKSLQFNSTINLCQDCQSLQRLALSRRHIDVPSPEEQSTKFHQEELNGTYIKLA